MKRYWLLPLTLIWLLSLASHAQMSEPDLPAIQEVNTRYPEAFMLPETQIVQKGMNNEVFVQQIGERQYAMLVQTGHYNAIDLSQGGTNNQIAVQ